MLIDYKKELESAAKSMILVHDPDLQIRMILRMVVQKIKVEHASILLHDRHKDTYILAVSKGSLSSKIPIGLARVDKDDPLVRFFRRDKDKSGLDRKNLVYSELKKLLSRKDIKEDLKTLLRQVLYQMAIFDAQVCIPSYFRDGLLGILLLGKKKDGKNFVQDELDFFAALASNLAMTVRNAQLFKELQQELEQKRQIFTRTTIALAAAIEAKDNYTHGHTTRVTSLSVEIAERIGQKNKKMFAQDFLDNLHIASLLHDIGKIGVPEYILNKRGELTIGERNRIREHPTIGAAILKPIKELEESLLGVKYHHEKYNGSGYPEGLKGEDIPLIASIISVADSFDAMTTDRPYRPALEKYKALAEIERLRGKQFNPEVASAFIELCREKEL